MLLKIKDKEYGLKWGMLAFENLEDELNVSGAEIIGMILDETSRGRDKTLRKLTYEAIKLSCRSQDVYCDLTYFDFVDWMDTEEQGSVQIQYIMTSFNESWYQGKQINAWITDIINLVEQSLRTQTEDDAKQVKKKTVVKRVPKSSKTATSGASRARTTKP